MKTIELEKGVKVESKGGKEFIITDLTEDMAVLTEIKTNKEEIVTWIKPMPYRTCYKCYQ